MGVCVDLVGQQFNHLIVIKRLENDKHKKARWLCECDCGRGEQIILNTTPLKSGAIKCCKLCTAEHRKPRGGDLTGQKFNHLLVLSFNREFTNEHHKTHSQQIGFWSCQCDCGNICNVDTASLHNGKRVDCGCGAKQRARILMKEVIRPLARVPEVNDLTGQRFGKLIVLSEVPERRKSHIYWTCKCDCGNIKEVCGSALKEGLTQSCGCLGSSVGEALIQKYLQEQNINFQKEYKFHDLCDKSQLRYDFAILDTNQQLIGLIEYDGRQHSDVTSIWHKETIVKHDHMKTEYAKDHNIPLLRISYKQQSQLNTILQNFIDTIL